MEGLDEGDQLALTNLFDILPGELERNAEIVRGYEELDELDVRTIQWFMPDVPARLLRGRVHDPAVRGLHGPRARGREPLLLLRRAEARLLQARRAQARRRVPGAGRLGGDAVAAREAPATTRSPTCGRPTSRSRRSGRRPTRRCASTAAAPSSSSSRTSSPRSTPPGRAGRWRRRPGTSASRASSTRRGWPTSTAHTGTPPCRSCPGWTPSATTRRPQAVRRRRAGQGLLLRAAVAAAQRVRARPVRARQGQGAARRPRRDRLRRRRLEPGRLQDARQAREPRRAALEEVAELYRSCDIGLVLMMTKHPSYQPLEFMASGMVTVTNANPATEWLLRHDENALVAPPAGSLIAEQIVRAAEDPELRERLTATALEEVRARRAGRISSSACGARSPSAASRSRRRRARSQALGDPRRLAAEHPRPEHDRADQISDRHRDPGQPPMASNVVGADGSTIQCARLLEQRRDRVEEQVPLRTRRAPSRSRRAPACRRTASSTTTAQIGETSR